jgi:hypothetical protein
VTTSEVCISGTGPGNLAGLCSYACNFGYYPVASCTCLEMGAQIDPSAVTSGPGYSLPGEDTTLYGGLCNFACSRGYCPPQACTQTNSTIVYVDPLIWEETNPLAIGPLPAIFVLPPSTLASPTTITFPPFVTTLEVGWITTIVISGETTSEFIAITTTTTLSIPDLTTSVMY